MSAVKKNIWMFFCVLMSAFIAALVITVAIAFGIGADGVPFVELRNDAIFALFIACVQMIWVGSDRSNKIYLIRTIIHFVALITGCTLLMVWFGWLPPGSYLLTYYVGFIVTYIVIWLIWWRIYRKKWARMNQKLDEYKKDHQ